MLNQLQDNLQRILKKILRKKGDFGVFVSGGIDSSVIAALAVKIRPDIKLITLSTPKSKDTYFAQILAQHLKKELLIKKVNKQDIEEKIDKIKEILRENQITSLKIHLPIAVGFYFLCQKANEQNIKNILTGQGPDILFAGYARYNNINNRFLNRKIISDLKLLNIDERRDKATADVFDITLHNPYLEKSFIDLSLKVKPQDKIRIENKKLINKYILRKLAMRLKLPNRIIFRKKHAIQYSTGISKIIQTK